MNNINTVTISRTAKALVRYEEEFHLTDEEFAEFNARDGLADEFLQDFEVWGYEEEMLEILDTTDVTVYITDGKNGFWEEPNQGVTQG